MVDSKGIAIAGPEQFDGWDQFTLAVGFTPAPITEMYEARNAQMGHERGLTQERSMLLEHFQRAHGEGDLEKRERALGDIREFNARHPQTAITFDTLYSGLVNRVEKANSVYKGANVRLPESKDKAKYYNTR